MIFSVSWVDLTVEWPVFLGYTAGSDEKLHVFLEVFLKFPENLSFYNENGPFLPKWCHLGVSKI